MAPLAQPRQEAPGAASSAGPNVLTANAASTSRVPMVQRSELERAQARIRAAERDFAAQKRQVEELQKLLAEARAQLAAQQRAKMPPPPSDREQILQMLGPVLKASNDGHN